MDPLRLCYTQGATDLPGVLLIPTLAFVFFVIFLFFFFFVFSFLFPLSARARLDRNARVIYRVVATKSRFLIR